MSAVIRARCWSSGFSGAGGGVSVMHMSSLPVVGAFRAVPGVRYVHRSGGDFADRLRKSAFAAAQHDEVADRATVALVASGYPTVPPGAQRCMPDEADGQPGFGLGGG